MDGCPTGKRRHDSQRAARAFIAGLPRALSHDRQRVYRCDRCSSWHVTTTPATRIVQQRGRSRRGYPPPPTDVATLAELDAWWSEHGGPS